MGNFLFPLFFMKKLLLLISFLLTTSVSYAKWWPIESAHTVTGEDILTIDRKFKDIHFDLKNKASQTNPRFYGVVTASSGVVITGDLTVTGSMSCYVDRGDPVNYDFKGADFTCDGSYYDLDLSTIVPSGVNAVHLRVVANADAINETLEFRENGNSNSANEGWFYTQVAKQAIAFDFICSCDSNQVIEYAISSGNYAFLNLTVRGWFK